MPISGLFNMFSSLANNSFNASEAAKNRRWQEQMYEKQYTDNVNLWKMQQDYNTPENQVVRLKQAGINPYLALGNISTGSASSVPQSAQAGSGAQATGTPAHFAGLTEGVLNLLKSKDERNLLKEQAKNIAADSLSKRIDSITQHQKNLADIIGLLRGSERDAASAALNRSFRQTEEELRGFKKQQYIDSSLESNLRRASMIQSLNYFPQQKRLEFAEILANIAESSSRKDLNREQIKHIAKQIVTEEARGLSQQQQNQLFDDTYNYLIDSYKHKSKGSNPFELFGGFVRSVEDYFKR